MERKGDSEAFILDVKRNPTALPLYQNLTGNNYEESWGYPELPLMISLAGYYILNIFYVSGTLCNYAQTKIYLTVHLYGEGNPHSLSIDQNTQTEGYPHPGVPNSKSYTSFHEPGISVAQVRRPLTFWLPGRSLHQEILS